ncbi:MAG: HEAT repeat domain-containing protein [Candidatus Zixiibacteriota bacterium]
MKTIAKPINESTIQTCLNDLAHTLVQELAVAWKKTSIYGPSHPLASRALGRPFLTLDKLFRIKRFVNINVQQGQLFVLNIRLRESMFNRQVIQYMQVSDVHSLLFEQHMSIADFTKFVEGFVIRSMHTGSDNPLAAHLRRQKINTIEANSETSLRQFETHPQYRGDIDGDFSVRRFGLEQMPTDPTELASFFSDPDVAWETYAADFSKEVFAYLLPEKIAMLSPSALVAALKKLSERMESGDESAAAAQASFAQLARLIDSHPDHAAIVQSLDDLHIGDSTASDFPSLLTIRPEAGYKSIEGIMRDLFETPDGSYDSSAFTEVFGRVLKTAQAEKAQAVIIQLLEHLASTETDRRMTALTLLLHAIDLLDMDSDQHVLKFTINQAIAVVGERRESFEYSEILWRLAEKSLAHSRFDLVATITGGLVKRREMRGDVRIYNSVAVKKVFDSIDRPQVIESLVKEMVQAGQKYSRDIRNVLIDVGSEEVALALSTVIAHPSRSVRQQTLKILSELGRPACTVFSSILMDDAMFDREEGRHELPDSQWFVLRNSIFVLGSLGDQEGIAALRLRLSDSDVRIRREVVCALEKIKGEDACDLLLMMAGDPVPEIGEKALIAAGLIGHADMAPAFIDVATNIPGQAGHAMTALGKIGGEQAIDFLARVLKDDDLLGSMASSGLSRDSLRMSAVRALGAIGTEDAVARVGEFDQATSATRKIFFKGSPLTKAVSDIIDRRK